MSRVIARPPRPARPAPPNLPFWGSGFWLERECYFRAYRASRSSGSATFVYIIRHEMLLSPKRAVKPARKGEFGEERVCDWFQNCRVSVECNVTFCRIRLAKSPSRRSWLASNTCRPPHRDGLRTPPREGRQHVFRTESPAQVDFASTQILYMVLQIESGVSSTYLVNDISCISPAGANSALTEPAYMFLRIESGVS